MSRTNFAWILIAAVAGAAAGAGSSALLSQQGPPPSVAAAGPEADTSAMEQRLGDLARGQAEVERALADVRSSLAMLAESSARKPALPGPADSHAGPRSEPAAVAAAVAAEAEPTAASLLAQLEAPDLTEMDRQMLWDKARKAGLTDALVKAFEERVAREPNNPDLRLDMGKAYLQKVFESGGGPMAGLWATKADKAFDAALELDHEHWEARFQKAVSLSFWPPAMGKQGQAIGEFERLIAQQDQGPKQDQHAQTYLFLGNMYQQSGSKQKALDAWQKGLSLFPENEALKKQIQNAQ